MQSLKVALLTVASFAIAATVSAQDRGYGRNPERLFWQVRDDLDRVQATTFPDGRDRKRLDHTRHELNELQDKFSRGRYDRGELNDVIGALSRVVGDNRMSLRDREVLNDDLQRLYAFRERHPH
jgi:hypothetical protein